MTEVDQTGLNLIIPTGSFEVTIRNHNENIIETLENGTVNLIKPSVMSPPYNPSQKVLFVEVGEGEKITEISAKDLSFSGNDTLKSSAIPASLSTKPPKLIELTVVVESSEPAPEPKDYLELTLSANSSKYRAYIADNQSGTSVVSELNINVVNEINKSLLGAPHSPNYFIIESLEDSEILTVIARPSVSSGFSFSGNENKYSSGINSDFISLYPNGLVTIDINISEAGGGGAETLSYNKIYHLNKENVEELSKVELTRADVNGTVIYDFSNYIINFVKYSFNFPSDNIVGTENIRLGGETLTTVEGELLKSENVFIDLGGVFIPNHINSLDIEGVKFSARVPFLANTIELDSDWCFGCEVSCHLIINLFAGGATLNILSNDNLVHSSIIKIGEDLPIKMQNDKVYLSLDSQQEIENGVRKFTVIKKKPTYATGINTPLIEVAGVVGDYVGYFEGVDLQVKGVSSGEAQEIKNILNNGVYVNA